MSEEYESDIELGNELLKQDQIKDAERTLVHVVLDLSRDLARGVVPAEVRELAEYVVTEGTARLKELGITPEAAQN